MGSPPSQALVWNTPSRTVQRPASSALSSANEPIGAVAHCERSVPATTKATTSPASRRSRRPSVNCRSSQLTAVPTLSERCPADGASRWRR